MHYQHNLLGRQWAVKVRLSEGLDGRGPRNLAGYRALCLTKTPAEIDCFVEIERPKSLGVVNVMFFEQSMSRRSDDDVIYCEIGIQDGQGAIEKIAAFSLEMV